ncbi:MAG: hypothetical protein ACRC3B_19540 [Bacteroidia bacterium]
MKFQINQVVRCSVFDYDYCIIAGTKEIPHKREHPFPETISPDYGYDYIIMPFKRFEEDGVPFFSGIHNVKEEWLSDVTDEFREYCIRQ